PGRARRPLRRVVLHAATASRCRHLPTSPPPRPTRPSRCSHRSCRDSDAAELWHAASVNLLERFREWRIDRRTDRIARRPHGRKARETYGAADAHSFLWEPVLEALALGSDDRLLDVGCGGGAFLRRARESGCAITGLDHSRDMVRVARAKTGARIELGA